MRQDPSCLAKGFSVRLSIGDLTRHRTACQTEGTDSGLWWRAACTRSV